MEVFIAILFVAIVVTFLLWLVRTDTVGQLYVAGSWREKWPAISDDEFVKKCGPGTDRDKALRVRRIVSEQLGIPYDHIHPEQNFVDDLGCG